MTSAAALSDFALPLVNVKSGWIFNFVASSVTVFDVAKEIHTQYIYKDSKILARVVCFAEQV